MKSLNTSCLHNQYIRARSIIRERARPILFSFLSPPPPPPLSIYMGLAIQLNVIVNFLKTQLRTYVVYI